MNYTIEAKGRN